jgi:hypothetical protein
LTKHNVSEIGFYLRLQVKPTQFCPIDRASPYPISETLCFVNILDKDKTMDNVHEYNICTNLPSSQTLRSVLEESFLRGLSDFVHFRLRPLKSHLKICTVCHAE